MKNITIKILLILLSLVITFTTFESLSWYHFCDIPTRVVRLRLVIFFIIVLIILIGIYNLINKLKTQYNKVN